MNLEHTDAPQARGFVTPDEPTPTSRPQADPNPAADTGTPTSSTPAATNSTPNTRSHEDLLAAVLAEHASPAQEAAAMQERIEREEAALLEALGEHREVLAAQAPPVHQQPSLQEQREQAQAEHHVEETLEEAHALTRKEHEQRSHNAQVEDVPTETLTQSLIHKPQLDANPHQRQEQQGARHYEQHPQQQQQQAQEPQPQQPAPAQAPGYTVAQVTPPAATPKRKPKAEPRSYGVGITVEVGHGLRLDMNTGNDDPVYQWLAAERQATEQRAMELRSIVRRWRDAAYQQLAQCYEMEDHHDKPCYEVPVEFFRFAEASAELVGVEELLTRLGVNPQRAGITQDVWDLFHQAVVDAQTDDGDEDGEGA